MGSQHMVSKRNKKNYPSLFIPLIQSSAVFYPTYLKASMKYKNYITEDKSEH